MENVEDLSLHRWLSVGSSSTTVSHPRFLRTVSSPLQTKYYPSPRRMSFLSGRSASIVVRWNDSIEEKGEFDLKIGASERAPTEISDLPDRCIVAIMANVVKAEDWSRYKLVSHRWCRLANQSLQALCFRQSGSFIPSLLGSLRTSVNLTSLQLHFSTPGAVTDSFLEQIGKTCPQVLSLNILYPESWSHNRFGGMINALPETSAGGGGVCFTGRKILSISEGHVTEAGFDGLFKGCRHLVELTVAATSVHQRGDVTEPFHMPPSISNLSQLSALAFHVRACASLPEDFGSLYNLEELSFSSEELLKLPDSFGDLCNLTSLDLSSCTKLKHLPESLGRLSSLTSLRLKGCYGLEDLPSSISGLISLSQLNCQDCCRLEELPDPIGSLSSLTSLDLSGCSSLTSLPETFCDLRRLRKLDVSNCPSLAIGPETTEHLGNLRPSDLWNLIVISHHRFPPPQVR